ncbi:unnamed protein product (macronuclear) [Paramecium tetraurelia]|uniref:RING-type domain-containing protein n=1 Tax=Paramecium tetraurelia TaxID=5888 RepID=A0CJI5_PARTE|nr:uncharacterized protein GSPATT00000663001 [Paramecium tetraurelia]CAK70952.1 unnamed protein product [Paramecium tetraurelia]|eukprot:XP_001438349.1 hypothetical protein (macronuclear) [Paramecium tetraurelia strain d4-2]
MFKNEILQNNIFLIMSLQENCSICFEDFEDPVKLPCNHIFCRDCIVVALEQRQSCPICRRLCCNYINSPFLSITQPEESLHEQEGDPCFIYRITIHHNAQAQFNFFEKRYVEMITEALKKNLTFIIDPQYNDCCMRVKLIECVPVHQHSIYVCTVQNIQRLKIVGFSERNIKDSDSKLKYATTQSIIDNFDQETLILYQKLHTCIEEIIQILSLNENAKSQLLALAGKKEETSPEKISKHSLEMLQTIQMCENGLLKWYYSTDINGRLGVILKHYESYLNYCQNQ